MLLLLSQMKTGLAAEDLSVNSVALEFETGNTMMLTHVNASLRARLTIQYSGIGLLEGRWLIAEPGAAEGQPMYRTLLLTRDKLVSSQRSIQESPELPTLRPGRYLLRFCVTNRKEADRRTELDNQCPNKPLIADASYQVSDLH